MSSKSYFSKVAISNVIEEVIRYFDEQNKNTDGYKTVSKEKLGAYLVSKNKINEATYDILTDYNRDFGKCHALIKKGQCNNPITKVNCIFCTYHSKNQPEKCIES